MVDGKKCISLRWDRYIFLYNDQLNINPNSIMYDKCKNSSQFACFSGFDPDWGVDKTYIVFPDSLKKWSSQEMGLEKASSNEEDEV